ncbi:T9SS type A sorting domain-containing protein [Fluviicola chungangensis]|uniref:T9SS type A sorting domain-containing protein n=1 Tax=Fluviicola chungangensis TaxID=2597671 RepID=A0A556MJJ6_9FLAO|nr:T9SS type A sorting domain-containing protein [Fluviicola chungangensis]TSJ39995.1 T9SS type A sorting domain-containing protein [Fluviicola chungangensis]
MRKFITGMFLLMGLHGWGQIDTVFLSREKLADTIYSELETKAPSGYLANKLSLLLSDSLLLKTDLFEGDSTIYKSNADRMLQWLYEMNQIAFEKNKLPPMDSLFNQVYSYVGEMDFEQEIIVVPLGIFELTYNLVDEQAGLNNGILEKDGSIWKDLDTSDSSIVSTDTSFLAGPLFDYFSSDVMGMVVKSDFFVSNIRKISDVLSLELGRDGDWKTIAFDEINYFAPHYDSIQFFRIRITYRDSTSKLIDFILNTPEVITKDDTKSFFTPEDWEGDDDDYATGCKKGDKKDPGCTRCGTVEDNGNKLKWCMIPACGRTRPEKPYILVTGYRPPMFGQGFRKTWTIYNDWHQNLLENLIGQEYDIFLVKFNIQSKPYQHGMQESASLLETFLNDLNLNLKSGQYFENIIQGSSMGEDIARLALLRMEQKHLDYSQNNPHHHSRLNIAYDANFYGANIPLGYQYQVYSANYYKSNVLGGNAFGTPTPLVNGVHYFLATFLLGTINQKTFKELVAYHAANYSDNIFLSPVQEINYTEPSYHWRRQNFLDALSAVDNGEHIFPIPVATRNIAISLGKISGKNSDGTEQYNNAGEYWQNISFLGYRFRIGTAKYMPSGQTFQIFRRQLPPLFLNPFQTVCRHEVNVSMMQEIDNVAGSNMIEIGNFISVADWTYFPITQIWNGKAFYSHKSVVTALGINRNLWPSDGSMTVNVQDLGLMNIGTQSNGVLIPSSHYGYPNLGRPNDHFQVTPFEAIYIDNKIDPHINLRDSDFDDVKALNDFIFDEAEPWYLKLQNQRVGFRARSNYTYYVRRRALNIITVGHLVTPATDPGDYVTQPNAMVDLRAGEEINLKPGVHFQSGSKVHLKIEFEQCEASSDLTVSGTRESVGNTTPEERLLPEMDNSPQERNMVVLYPNPTNDGTFSLKTAPEAVISSIRIYSMFGTIIDDINTLEETEYVHRNPLKTGTYLIRVTTNSKTETHKLLVL